MELSQFDHQIKEELSLIEVAHAILEEKGTVIDFTELLIAVQNYLNLAEETVEAKMIRFYTDLNIDGRFISLGENQWGLRAWFAVDEIDEEIITSSEEEAPKVQKKSSGKYNAYADNQDDVTNYNDDDPEDGETSYEEEDYQDDEDDEDEDDDSMEVLVADVEEEDDEEDQELNEYASDLSELGDDEIDLDEEDDFEDSDDEDYSEEDLDDESDEANEEEDD